jgi:hypothetical protein
MFSSSKLPRFIFLIFDKNSLLGIVSILARQLGVKGNLTQGTAETAERFGSLAIWQHS